MGNNSSTTSNSINSTKINNNNKKNTDFDHGAIFDKILNISNDMIMKYKNNFLDPEFCKNIALVYQNKLNELDIKVLREINNNLNNNSNKTNNSNNTNSNTNKKSKELRLLLQYNPKEDDTFFVNSFKDKLQELFWGKNVNYSKDIFSDNHITKNFDAIIKNIQYKPFYINVKYVNKLLNSLDNTIKQSGGDLNKFNKNLNNNLSKLNKKINSTKKII